MNPPDGFTDSALLSPRGAIFVGRADQLAALDAAYMAGSKHVDTLQRLSAREVLDRVPVLREDYVAAGVLEADAMDMDVNALHQGFLRGARNRGAELRPRARVESLQRRDGAWRVRAGGKEIGAGVVINAAGAWCDQIADLAGARRIGLMPKRRTAILFDGPEAHDFAGWPAFIDVDEEFYARPESGALMGSPADETPVEPCDVQPEEMDIAIAVDRLQKATTLDIRRINRSWAGLRSFVADKTPVVGFDPVAEGFFWLAGQGGYGIQTAPSMGRVSAALAMGEAVPDDLRRFGVRAADLSPARFKES
jgi:D-arginine dehydrogenase